MINAFPQLKDRLKKVDSTALFNVVKDLSRVSLDNDNRNDNVVKILF